MQWLLVQLLRVHLGPSQNSSSSDIGAIVSGGVVGGVVAVALMAAANLLYRLKVSKQSQPMIASPAEGFGKNSVDEYEMFVESGKLKVSHPDAELFASHE
jgi:hypothetical protein